MPASMARSVGSAQDVRRPAPKPDRIAVAMLRSTSTGHHRGSPIAERLPQRPSTRSTIATIHVIRASCIRTRAVDPATESPTAGWRSPDSARWLAWPPPVVPRRRRCSTPERRVRPRGEVHRGSPPRRDANGRAPRRRSRPGFVRPRPRRNRVARASGTARTTRTIAPPRQATRASRPASSRTTRRRGPRGDTAPWADGRRRRSRNHPTAAGARCRRADAP